MGLTNRQFSETFNGYDQSDNPNVLLFRSFGVVSEILKSKIPDNNLVERVILRKAASVDTMFL